MDEMPCLVFDLQRQAPKGGHHECNHRENRQKREVGAQRRLKHIGRREQLRLDDEQNGGMRYDQADRYQRNLTVKMIDDVFAPRLGDILEARGETELQAHHRKAGIAEGDRELSPETARWRMRACQQREQGSENEQQIDEDPNGPA